MNILQTKKQVFKINLRIKLEGFIVGTSTIVGILKRKGLWNYNMNIKDKTVYQLTGIDLETRYTWREIYEEETRSYFKDILSISLVLPQ